MSREKDFINKVSSTLTTSGGIISNIINTAGAIKDSASTINGAIQNIKNSSKYTNTIDDDEIKTIDNVITTTDKDSLKRYGIRQEIVIKSDKEDSVQKAKRILTEHIRATEEITVKCIGDVDYRVGFGVHIVIPFLTKYYDCFMYVKEVEHEWVSGDTFTSTLTLTPSRVMDEHEWSDVTESDEDGTESGGSELWEKIKALLKQQLGKPYVYGSTDAPNSFDCSSLVQYCYNQYADEIGETLGRDTYTQCKQGRPVECSSASEIPNVCQEGDLLFWKTKSNPPGHVSVYWGNNQMIHAPYTGEVVKIVDITRTDLYCVRRVLPESVQVYDDGGSADIPSEYLNVIKTGVESNVSTFIKNLDNYGYKNNLITICKQNNIEPYTMAGIICIESEGNPFCGTTYKGLCQCEGGSTDPATNIKQGCEMYNQKCQATGNSSFWVSCSAYNSGEGTVINACKEYGLDMKTCSVKQLGDALYGYVSSHNPGWSASEKKYYASKVILAKSILKSKNVLG